MRWRRVCDVLCALIGVDFDVALSIHSASFLHRKQKYNESIHFISCKFAKITIFRTVELQIRNVYAMCESKINIGTQYVYLLYGQLCVSGEASTTLLQLLSLSCGKRKSRIYWLNESLGLQPWNSVLALNFAKEKSQSRVGWVYIHSWIQHILPYKEIALRLLEDKCCAENMKRW